MNPPLTANPTSSYAGSSPNLRHQQPSNTPQLGSTPRPRQAFALPVTPGANRTIPRTDYGQDVKETQLVSPPNGENYHPNGGANSRNHLYPNHYEASSDTTLSTFLHNVFTSAKSTISKSSVSTSESIQSQITSFFSIKLPSPATIGFIFLCTLWYISSALSSNTGKSILTQFRYPVTLTFIQFAFVAGYSILFLAVRERFKGGTGWGIKKPSKGMWEGTFIMSLFQIAGHVFSSMAIARVPVSTVHTIKALSPLFTVVSYALLFKVRYGAATYIALLPLTLGVMLACSFDLRANAVGFLCALGSTIIFVSQNIFSKKLLPKEGTNTVISGTTGVKLDKLNLLFYSSGMAFLLMIPIWLYSDSSALYTSYSTLPPPPSPSHTSSTLPPSNHLILYFVLNGSVHFAQNLLAFSILAKTSPVTYSIASLVKRIAVICLAIIWSGQIVSWVQGAGMAMTFFGLALYNRAKGDVEKGERKRLVREKMEDFTLPLSTGDAKDGLGLGLGLLGDKAAVRRQLSMSLPVLHT